MKISYNKEWISILGLMASALSTVLNITPANQKQIDRCTNEAEEFKQSILNAIKENTRSKGETIHLESMKSLIQNVIDESKTHELPDWIKDYFTFFETSYLDFCKSLN